MPGRLLAAMQQALLHNCLVVCAHGSHASRWCASVPCAAALWVLTHWFLRAVVGAGPGRPLSPLPLARWHRARRAPPGHMHARGVCRRVLLLARPSAVRVACLGREPACVSPHSAARAQACVQTSPSPLHWLAQLRPPPAARAHCRRDSGPASAALCIA